MVACWHIGGQTRRSDRERYDAWEVAVDLAGDVTLEDTHDLRLALAFESAPLDVGAGARVRAHAGEHDAPQGMVGLTVAAPVESMADRLAGRGVDRGDPAEVGEGGFGGDPLGVVTGGDEQQRGGVDADTVEGEEARRGGPDERA